MLKYSKRLFSKQVGLHQTGSCGFASKNYYGDLMAFHENEEHFHTKTELENYVHFVRQNGHNYATIDPLGLIKRYYPIFCLFL